MGNKSRLSISEISVLTTCCEIEERVASIYRFFGQLYAEDAILSELWNKTAMEEDNHAEQFRLAVRLHGVGMDSVKSDEKTVNATLFRVKEVSHLIINCPPSAVEALQFAIKVEQALAAYHMESIVCYDDPRLANLFIAMSKNDQGHVLKLQQKYDELTCVNLSSEANLL